MIKYSRIFQVDEHRGFSELMRKTWVNINNGREGRKRELGTFFETKFIRKQEVESGTECHLCRDQPVYCANQRAGHANY